MASSGTSAGAERSAWRKAGAGLLLAVGWLVVVWAAYTAVGAGPRWLLVAVTVGALPFVALVRWLVWRHQVAALDGSDDEA